MPELVNRLEKREGLASGSAKARAAVEGNVPERHWRGLALIGNETLRGGVIRSWLHVARTQI